MRVAYTAGRYRAPTIWGVVANIRAAEEVAVALWRMGIAALCPHKNTALLDGATGGAGFGDAAVWLEGDLEMLRRCDCVVMIPGWESSEGATAEHAEAKRCGIPVFYWPQDWDVLERMGHEQTATV